MTSAESKPPASSANPPRATLDVVIRFKNSAATLPPVLTALAAQTLRPDRILGVDTGSGDRSAELIRQAGGDVIRWDAPYSHPKVLNFAVRHCTGTLVLALSSHTSLTDPETLARLVAAM
ncbi:MAG: family 2 glycosyl transferase, partial [Akkermansiaceae bacterium]|nr:family 2 glycosyl transferase [Akkermansiaceae bacterium]